MEVYFRNFIYFINLYLRRANCNSSINSFHQGLFQNIAILQRYFEKKVYDVYDGGGSIIELEIIRISEAMSRKSKIKRKRKMIWFILTSIFAFSVFCLTV